MDQNNEKNIWKTMYLQEVKRREELQDRMPKGKVVKQLDTNNYVKVKLTEKGEKIYREYYNTEPRKNEEGYTYFQLWILMKVFGPHMKLGKGPEFEENCIFVDEKEFKV